MTKRSSAGQLAAQDGELRSATPLSPALPRVSALALIANGKRFNRCKEQYYYSQERNTWNQVTSRMGKRIKDCTALVIPCPHEMLV